MSLKNQSLLSLIRHPPHRPRQDISADRPPRNHTMPRADEPVPHQEPMLVISDSCIEYKSYALKRALDVMMAVVLLLFFSPLFALIAFTITLTDSGSIFYAHKRVGRNGREFGCLKFRTMVSNGDQALAAYLAVSPAARTEWLLTRKLKHDPRVTPIGRILRTSSLDELPQLVNVLRGEMSLVGPRPVMADELAHYGNRKQTYYRVRPGLTGLWQVSGRSDLSYEKRVDLDCQYVENISFSEDLKLMLRTIPAVLLAKGSR